MSAATDNLSVSQGASSRLGSLQQLSAEIRQKIFKIAVQADAKIAPSQLKHKSNKFLWSKAQEGVPAWGPARVSAVPQLDVVAMSLVCKAMYEEVATTHLFYRVNEFDFKDCEPHQIITYLMAITQERQRQITHIHFSLAFIGYWKVVNEQQAILFDLFTTMQGLRRIDGYITALPEHPEGFIGYCSFVKYLGSTKNLELKLHYKNASIDTGPLTEAQEAQRENRALQLAKLQQNLRDHIGSSASDEKKAPADFIMTRKAQRLISLDVYGEGRLSDDKKPHLVSSRTRAGTRKVADQDGVIPAPSVPKYDLDGNLAWTVCSIEDVRFDEGTETFEYLVTTKCRRYGFTQSESEQSWESFAIVDHAWCGRDQLKIFYMYKKNDEVLGREEFMTLRKEETAANQAAKVAKRFKQAMKRGRRQDD